MLRKDKQKHLDHMCDELESASAIGNVHKLYGAVWSVTRKFQPHLHCIESASGEIITETEKIAERWREYCEDLYTEDRVQHSQLIRQYVKEPPPLKSEITRALKQTASHKSFGPDGVPAELLKEDVTWDRIHNICVDIWETGEWPDNWTNSTFIPLPKKGNLKQCQNYWIIALVSNAKFCSESS